MLPLNLALKLTYKCLTQQMLTTGATNSTIGIKNSTNRRMIKTKGIKIRKANFNVYYYQD